MVTRALLILNAFLAAAAGVYLWVMLPFAQGAACEGQRIVGRSCEGPMSLAGLMSVSLSPAALVLVVSAVALTRKTASWKYRWLAVPAMISAAWVFFVLFNIARHEP